MKKLIILILLLLTVSGCRERESKDSEKQIETQYITLTYEPEALKYYLYGQLEGEYEIKDEIPEKPLLNTEYPVEIVQDENVIAKYVVKFQDRYAPTITLTAEEPRAAFQHLLDVEITDDYDDLENIEILLSGVNLHQDGRYYAAIYVEDSSGNGASVNCIVEAMHDLEGGIPFTWNESYVNPIGTYSPLQEGFDD